MDLELQSTSTSSGSSDLRGSQGEMLSPFFPACPLPDGAFYFSSHLEAKICFPWCVVDHAGEGTEGNKWTLYYFLFLLQL